MGMAAGRAGAAAAAPQGDQPDPQEARQPLWRTGLVRSRSGGVRHPRRGAGIRQSMSAFLKGLGGVTLAAVVLYAMQHTTPGYGDITSPRPVAGTLGHRLQ